MQAIQIGALLRALGLGGPGRALALTGASIVGTSVGVAVPGQLRGHRQRDGARGAGASG